MTARLPEMPAAIRHRPERPDWLCTLCGHFWPCPEARLELERAFTSRHKLRVCLLHCLAAMGDDLAPVRGAAWFVETAIPHVTAWVADQALPVPHQYARARSQYTRPYAGWVNGGRWERRAR